MPTRNWISILLIVLFQPVLADQTLTRLPQPIPAPEFELKDLEGETRKLDDYLGKPLIVNFWATWCPPCREEMPSMDRAWQKIKGDGIGMIAVNVGEDEDTVFSFTGDYPVTFTILLDEDSHMVSDWPVKGLPTTFVLDSSGNIVYRAIGGREWDDDKLLEMVRALR